MWKVVLGGGLASGKSTVATMMAELGAQVSDMDTLAVEVRNLPEVAQELAACFGNDILDDNNCPIPSLLAQRAFADAKSTHALNEICHPRIAERARAFLRETKPDEVRVIEVPLLERAHDLREMADEVVLVITPLQMRNERAVARGMKSEDARRRIAAQVIDNDLLSLADTVFENNASLDELKQQVEQWWHAHDARDAASKGM